MKRIPLDQLRQTPHWHQALAMGKVVDGVAVELPEEFPLTPAPPLLPQSSAIRHRLFGELKLADPPTQAARHAQCQACAHNLEGQCALCRTCGGRPIDSKVKPAWEKCPLGKW